MLLRVLLLRHSTVQAAIAAAEQNNEEACMACCQCYAYVTERLLPLHAARIVLLLSQYPSEEHRCDPFAGLAESGSLPRVGFSEVSRRFNSSSSLKLG